MCLLTIQKTPKKTEKDITVYKIMNRHEITPPFNDFKYELKKLYKTELDQTEDTSSFDDYDDEARNEAKRKVISIGPGFHSSLTIERLKRDNYNVNNYYLYKCVIPKGSLYYKGFTDLIVSNKIKILEKISWD